jgi:putrescine aminotransferase
MGALGASMVPTFVAGHGCRLVDAGGREYLDFVGGYGATSLGHNHPAVVAAVQRALAEAAPGFAPAAINPHAAALAEDLVAASPAGLEIVSFANSGAEAVEAALKLARCATGRTAVLSCLRSFHGKTMGALSATGQAHYRRPFEPLLPHYEAVPFGDAEAVARALASERFAAFIVEPVQAEGGIFVAPPGYLQAVQAACRATGTLFVVDEVQTGLGRTGTLFASTAHGVEPDVMALAKALGGGLVPLGAMLARRCHWMQAYGRIDTFALHSSTFAGGSVACAVGRAALAPQSDAALLANLRDRQAQLWAGLLALRQRHTIVKDVRGEGLLLALELEPAPPSVATLWQDQLALGLPPSAVPGLERQVGALTALHLASLLLQEHGIYVQTTRSNPLVLRIEPPLIVTAEEAATFLAALETACAEVESSMITFDEMIAKAVVGEKAGRTS